MSTLVVRASSSLRDFSCDSILFDLDGTLADTSTDLWMALQAALEVYGLPQADRKVFLDSLHFGIEKSVDHILDSLSAHGVAPKALVNTYKRSYKDLAHRNSRLYQGVENMLSRFKTAGLKLAVCTNKESHSSYELLEKLRISHYFDTVVGIDQVVRPKPSPESLRQAAAFLQVSPADCIFVGDSHLDALASKAAGIPFLMHLKGYGASSVDPQTVDASIASFDDLVLAPATSLRCKR